MALKSIIKDALERTQDTGGQETSPVMPVAAEEPTPQSIMTPKAMAEDEELRRVLAGLKTNIKIVGAGGGGSNTINRIVEEGIVGADLFAMNSDAQHLLTVHSPHKILIGRRSTRGLGAGSRPQVGREAALEAEEEVRAALQGADMVFITCGLGGGTGTGAAPVIARIAKELGALTIAIVTRPFSGEGVARAQNADYGQEELEVVCDTVIVIPNDKLLEIVPRLPLNAAFKVADELLMRAIKGITEMITKVGLVNLDFADLKTIMKGGGVAVIGLGEASDTPEKATEAVNEALNSPLLEVDVSNATGALICVTGGDDMTVTEAEMVADEIHKRINANAGIIWGAYIDPSLSHTIRVMVVITGVKSTQIGGKSQYSYLGGPPGRGGGGGGGGRGGGSKLGIDFIR
jgi:cell division protein FtsZ